MIVKRSFVLPHPRTAPKILNQRGVTQIGKKERRLKKESVDPQQNGHISLAGRWPFFWRVFLDSLKNAG